MKKTFSLLLVFAIALCALVAAQAESVSLNDATLDEIIAKAQEIGDIQSVGMPDDWANWGETWGDILETYGITHSDIDMSSGEELALFAAESGAGTKDIGDVGQSYAPVALEMDVVQPYKPTTWDTIPDFARLDDDGYCIMAYYGTIAFITNTSLVDTPPASWADILEGDYKVSIGDVTVGTSSQCSVLSAALAFGGSEADVQPGIDFFIELAEAGRIDTGDASTARLEKGEIAVMVTWDYLALQRRDTILANNPDMSFDICIPSDGAIQSGYTTVLNKYAPNPWGAALAREYIFSDAGQINLARGYAKPVRDVELPEELQAAMIPDEQYANARFIEDYDAWTESVAYMSQAWEEEVIPSLPQ